MADSRRTSPSPAVKPGTGWISSSRTTLTPSIHAAVSPTPPSNQKPFKSIITLYLPSVRVGEGFMKSVGISAIHHKGRRNTSRASKFLANAQSTRSEGDASFARCTSEHPTSLADAHQGLEMRARPRRCDSLGALRTMRARAIRRASTDAIEELLHDPPGDVTDRLHNDLDIDVHYIGFPGWTGRPEHRDRRKELAL